VFSDLIEIAGQHLNPHSPDEAAILSPLAAVMG
jgi:hypothetical protein